MCNPPIVYNPNFAKEDKINALDLAVKKLGVGNVIMKMDAELHEFPFKKQHIVYEDMQYVIQSYDLSFRSFGYSMKKDDKNRQSILDILCKHYGVLKCLKHFDSLASKQKKYIDIIAKDSLYIKNKYNVILSNVQPNLEKIIKKISPIHLRAYGYQIVHNKDSRQAAIYSAIKENGKKKVYDRLMEISKYYINNKNILDDINFVSKKY